jgi:hypothetical protein
LLRNLLADVVPLCFRDLKQMQGCHLDAVVEEIKPVTLFLYDLLNLVVFIDTDVNQNCRLRTTRFVVGRIQL